MLLLAVPVRSRRIKEPDMSASPDPEEAFARWLAAHPAATLLEIAAFFAQRGRPVPPARAPR